MAIPRAAKAKAEGDIRASSKHPLRNHALARFAHNVGFPQLGQSFLVGVRSDAASPIDVLDIGFLTGGTASGQKGRHNEG